MTWLVSSSLHLRVIVLALSILLVVFGIRTLEKTALDVFPEFAPPMVEIQTEAPGLSTEEVESMVSMPIENALTGAPWVKTIRSKSVLGLSSVVLIFEEGTDLIRARQLVQERMAAEASRLPTVARPPVMMSPHSSTARVLKIGVSSKTLSQMEMTELAKWTIRPRLMSISGVANVAIWGERDRQFQVQVDPDRLRSHSVTLDQVVRATTDTVSLSGGGFVDTPNQRIAIRQVNGVRTAEDISESVVDFRNGAPLRLRDVADVCENFAAPIGDAVIDDEPGLLLIVEKQPWGNTLDVTRNVEKALADMEPALPGMKIDSTIFRPATFIERALTNLSHAMLIGCGLVIVILAAFLFDWRTALISMTAIPLSLIAAALVLHFSGATMNTMVIAGLVIALGEVVDDAIIDVENILRRLRLNNESAQPQSPFSVVLAASLEVRSAVVYASVIVTLVFMPVLFLDGLSGAFFRPLAIAYILAVLASLLVALTVTPALSLMLLPSAGHRRHDAPLTVFLKAIYLRMLPFFLKRPGQSLAFLCLMIAVTGGSVRYLGEEYLPHFQETDFLMHFVEKPGTSLDAMRRVTARASKELRHGVKVRNYSGQEVNPVRNFGSHIGRATVADEVVGPNFTELWISIDDDVPYKETVAKIQEVVDGYPGLKRDLLTYLKEAIKEVLTGSGGSIVVRIYGPELAVLRSQAQKVKKLMEGVAGTSDQQVETQALVPQLQVRLRPDAAARFGLTGGQIRRAVDTLVKGNKVGEVYYNQMSFETVVWGIPEIRNDISAICKLPIDLPQGGYVPLGDVADIEITPAPNEIKREKASRRIDVTCNVTGRDLGSVAREIQQLVSDPENIQFDAGYFPEFLGEYAARAESQRRLFLLSSLSLIGIFLLLQLDFRSWKLALMVLFTIQFALVGGVVGTFLQGGVLSLGSLVGFVTVLGIAARNGIMLVSHYRHLEEVEGEKFGIDLVMRGSAERLSPILMTALATGLALVPLIIGGNKPGHEIEYPMAVVILGGLITSTILNLFLLPPLYAAYGRVTLAPVDASRG